MQAIKAVMVFCSMLAAASAYADAKCDATAKTRDDFLACERADIGRTLSDADKLYKNIRSKLTDGKLSALDSNKKLWETRIKSECDIVGYAFNDWTSEYTPDTDFQVSACEANIAKQELAFYKYISCPDDMETSAVPKCAAIKSVLGHQ